MNLQELETKFGVSLADPQFDALLEMYCECKRDMMSSIIEGEEVSEFPRNRTGGIADIMVKLFTEKLLPLLIEKYGDQFVQLIISKLMEWIMRSLKARGA